MIPHVCTCHKTQLSCLLAAANATPCPLLLHRAPQAAPATCATISPRPSPTTPLQHARYPKPIIPTHPQTQTPTENQNPQPPTPLLTPGQSMPLLPLTSWGNKLWVAIDGRAIDRHNRCGCSGGAVIVVVMLATGTLGTPLPPSCTTAAPTCHGAHTPAARVPASACTRPSAATQLRCLSTCLSLRRVCPIYAR